MITASYIPNGQFSVIRINMIQTKTIAVVLIAIATVGAIGIGIGTGIQSVHAQRGFGPGQNDDNQGNNNIQGATNCFGFGRSPACGENPQGNQP